VTRRKRFPNLVRALAAKARKREEEKGDLCASSGVKPVPFEDDCAVSRGDDLHDAKTSVGVATNSLNLAEREAITLGG